MKKNIIIVSVFLLIVSGLYNYINKKTLIKKKIVAGVMNGWYPFMFINNKNEYDGFDVDIIKALEKELNRDIEIRDLGSLDSLFIALQQGSIDMVLSGLDITEIRKNTYNMIYYAGFPCDTITLLYKNKPLNDSILPCSVCVEGGSAVEKLPFSLNISSSILASSLSEMILQLEYEKVDSLILENHVAETVKELKPLWYSKKIKRPDNFCIEGMGIAIEKNNKQLSLLVKQGIKKLRELGVIEKFEKKWNIQ
jgi:ABC-type amino acid transport substrate-binding protein